MFENITWFSLNIYSIYAILIFVIGTIVLIGSIMREIIWGDSVSELMDVFLWLIKGFTSITIVAVLWPIVLILITMTVVIYYSSKSISKRVW